MNNNKDCQNRREAIAALVLGELETPAADEIKNHIDTCMNCRSLYQAMVEEEDTIRSAFKAIDDRSKAIGNKLVSQSGKVSRAHDDISAGQTESQVKKSAVIRPNVWRTIMKSRITKLAAAAVIIIGLGMAVRLIEKTTTPVWAIEQSIEAMKNYRGIYFSGKIFMPWEDFFRGLGVKNIPELPESLGDFEMWAQADEELSRSSNVKIVCPDKIIISGRKLQSYIQLTDGTTYDVQGDYMKIDPWPTSMFLEIVKQNKSNWTELYGVDAETGKERIFVKYSWADMNKSWECEFDSESKLMVSLRQWENSDKHEGRPTFDIRKIVYFEQLPDEIFEIELPGSNKIIAVNTPVYDPNYGINTEGLNQEQACHKILKEFWRAVNEQDLDKIRKLVPYTAEWSDEILIANLGGALEPAEFVEMGQIYETEIGLVVPCTIQLEDKKMIIEMIVMFREIDGKSSCIILSNKGQPRRVE